MFIFRLRGAALAFAVPSLVVTSMSACLWPGIARAQQTVPDDSQPTQLDEVTVTARRGFDDRFMSTASRITISRRDIEDMGANSIGDILCQIPGVQVTTTANGGLEIRMRGMGPEATRILIDGIPASTANRTAQLPLDELPADLIERIEVLRAPTAEYQGAPAGSLNIVLRGASPKKETYVWFTDQMVWGEQGPSLFISQTGPLGEAPPAAGQAASRAKEAVSPPAANWSYFMSLNVGERNLGSDTQRITTINGAAPTAYATDDKVRLTNRYWTLTPRVTGRFGTSDRLTFRGMLSGLEQPGSVLSTSGGQSGGAAFFSTSQTPWRYDRGFQQAALDWSHSFQDAKWDSTLQLEHSHATDHANGSVLSTLGAVITAQTSTYDQDRSDRGVIAKSKLAMAFGEAVWSVGGDYESRRDEVDSATNLGTGGVPLDVASSTRRRALWTQYEWPLESIKTSAALGLRAQDFTVNETAAGTPGSFHYAFLQPSLNTRTALSDDLQYRFNIARITRDPRVWEITLFIEPNLATNSPNAPDFQGNPSLKPESTLTLDTGLETRLKVGGQAGINLFVRQQSNVIARRLFLLGTRWTEQPGNIGQAQVWGIETDLRSNLTWAGLPRDWTISANASLLNSRFEDGTVSGQRIPGQARYLGNLNIAKPLRLSGGWYGGGTLSLTGAADLNTASAPGVVVSGTQRAHQQLDLYVGSVAPKVGFWRLNVYNVTDFRDDRTRVVADNLNGVVYTEQSERHLTPRWFLTLGTRF